VKRLVCSESLLSPLTTQHQEGRTKTGILGITAFSTNYTTSRSKNKDWYARNHNYVSERSNMSLLLSLLLTTQHQEVRTKTGMPS
jgi:uncharacterized protein (UPF0303 family)